MNLYPDQNEFMDINRCCRKNDGKLNRFEKRTRSKKDLIQNEDIVRHQRFQKEWIDKNKDIDLYINHLNSDFNDNQKENVYFHKDLYQCCVEHIYPYHHDEKIDLHNRHQDESDID